MEYQQGAFTANLDATAPSTGVERWFCGSIEGWVSEGQLLICKKECRKRVLSKHLHSFHPTMCPSAYPM